MQLMPETATDLDVFDIYDPQENINGGTRYLAQLLKRYDGSVTHAVAAYNAGQGRIEPQQPVTITFKETRGYIDKVLTTLTKLETGKEDSDKAQILLADWQYAEEVYQAGLKGIILPPTRPQPIEVEPTQPQVVLAVLQQNAADAGKAPANVVNASLTSVQASAVVPTAPVAEPASPASALTDVKFVERATPTATNTDNSIPSCASLPNALGQWTQQQGSGRYSAYFYYVQSQDTLASIGKRLGLDTTSIMILNNLPIGGDLAQMPLDVGERLKVAECLR